MKRLALAALALAALACTVSSPEVTQLVSRADARPTPFCGREQCRWWQPEMTFRDGRGGTAIMSASQRRARYEVVSASEAACGATSSSTATTYRLDYRDLPGTADPSVELSFDGGSAMRLFPEEITAVLDTCIDETGRWEGVTGRYVGRRGTYRSVWERLQVELTLTDTAT